MLGSWLSGPGCAFSFVGIQTRSQAANGPSGMSAFLSSKKQNPCKVGLTGVLQAACSAASGKAEGEVLVSEPLSIEWIS